MGIIRVLSPETARLIAAGEVVDRPAAALRELLDNAIDAGAKEISVQIEGGGVAALRVTDDGSGMDRDDLELSVLPHATSKIVDADDLLRARTLGFRGEALASIAAVARLEILSKTEASPTAWRLSVGPGTPPRVEAAAGRRGTTVSLAGLFDDFPARKQFLKRPQAEAALCRQILTDKALAHPELLFRYASVGAGVNVLTATDRIGRISSVHPDLPRELLYAVKFSGTGFEGEAIVAGPGWSRGDRRSMQTYVNRRRVQEWSLIQALDYAFSGYLPGGAHPCAFLFVEIDPALADFNIHPAKREVRLKDVESLRRAVIGSLQSFLSNLSRRSPEKLAPRADAELGLTPVYRAASGWGSGRFPGDRSGELGDTAQRTNGAVSWSAFDELRERSSPLPPVGAQAAAFRYLGRALGPFLLFEMGDELFFLDQHAAHERLIFDALESKTPEVQELLVAEPIEPEDEAEAERLDALATEVAGAGFRLEREGEHWLLVAAPALIREDPAGALRELLRSGSSGAEALRDARALIACRAAVKDGDELDRAAAEELIASALELPEARCPHGRPIWTRLSRDQLYRLVRRIV